jgi:methylmalonyl-CoA/ethylmalonyl-CoA epimerase
VISADARLHHVGFVVADIESAIAGFKRSTLADWDGRIWDDPDQRVRVAFLTAGGSPAQIELVSPLGEDSPVTPFLEGGGGLHHLCYEIAELDARLAEMRELGNLIVRPPTPAIAFENRRIAWLITREKLLIELLERPVLP